MLITLFTINWIGFYLVPTYDLWKDRRKDFITNNNLSPFYSKKQIYSIFPWVCTVKGHRIPQNLVRSRQWHTRLRLACNFFVLNKLWCHLWSITEQIPGNVESICQIDLTIKFHLWCHSFLLLAKEQSSSHFWFLNFEFLKRNHLFLKLHTKLFAITNTMPSGRVTS